MKYAIALGQDSNDTLLVSVPDLPWVHTFGDTEAEAKERAVEALLTAFEMLIRERRPIPAPRRHRDHLYVDVPAMVAAKIGLHNALLAAGVTRAELARRMGIHRPQVDRLFDLDHASTLDQLERALAELGARIDLNVVTQ